MTLEATDRPHEHFAFRDLLEMRALLAVESEQLLACVECRSRARHLLRDPLRALAQAPDVPPETTEAVERAIAEEEQTDPQAREEAAWRDAGYGTAQ